VKKLILLTIIVVTGLLLYIKLNFDRSPGELTDLPADAVATAEISSGTISSDIAGRGKVIPNRLVSVISSVEGQIIEILVKENQKVKKGQCLLKLDISPKFKFKLLKLKHKVLGNDNKRKQLNKQIDLQRRLNKDGLAAQVKIKNLEKEIKWAEIEEKELNNQRFLLAKQLGLTLTKSRLINDDLTQINDSCIQASIDGTILQINKFVDDMVYAARNSDGPAIMIIADLSNYFIDYKVSEMDLSEIKVGQKVEIIFDSWPEKLFHGEIDTISSIGFRSNTGFESFKDPSKEMSYYRTKIRVIDPIPELQLDLSCRISIKTTTRSNVLLAPVTSVFSEETGEQFIFIDLDGTAERRQVQTGIADISMIEIQSGLGEGDIVYLNPYKIIEHRKIIKEAQSKTFIQKILR